MKVCSDCRQVKRLDAFNADYRNADGRVGRCRECANVRRAQRRARETPEQRAERREKQRRYSATYRRSALGTATRRAHSAKRPVSAVDRNRRGARAAVANAIAHGWPVPSTCERCGDAPDDNGVRRPIEAHHHHGYDPKHWLDVVWLCVPCHGREHRAES